MAAPQGISLAFDDPTLEPDPTWTRLDDGVTRVASYTIDRGRVFELDQTDAGRASIQINDVDGTLDPTNPGSPYFGRLQPLIQAAIARWNPVAEEWDTRFRGFIEEMDYDFDPSQQLNRLTLSLVDIFDPLTASEMQPSTFGDPGSAPPASASNVYFAPADQVGDRIVQILGDANVDPAFYHVFSGNVSVIATVYSPGESALEAIQDAANAEFPGVANVYTDRFGCIVFHGRLAKFDPASVISGMDDPSDWDYHEWKAGDGAAVNASPADTAHIRAFSFNRGLSKIINSARADPMGISSADAADSSRLITDGTSISQNGIRSWSISNLITDEGLLDGNDALAETKLFAQYRVDNYAVPRNRITQIAFRPMVPGAVGAAANHLLLGKIDIADSVAVTIGSPGGGGFSAEGFFVEGVHEQVDGRLRAGVSDGDEGYDNVTLTLDISPRAYYDTNPFPSS